ncbi:hypothetical protein F5Y14DRAFT_50918 [Nemania sp. NC0429]|nr:hypothetical protein F5Y14DRAFT_50918 [Nemania sp. NC0429]
MAQLLLEATGTGVRYKIPLLHHRERRKDSENYWPFELGPRTRRADTWDLYYKRKEDTAIAVEPNQSPGHGDATYLVNLRLGNLGLKGKFLRKAGALNSGYAIRPLGPK